MMTVHGIAVDSINPPFVVDADSILDLNLSACSMKLDRAVVEVEKDSNLTSDHVCRRCSLSICPHYHWENRICTM